MKSLGKVQIQSVKNKQIWQAMPNEDYSAVVLADAPTASMTYFEVMEMIDNQICLQSAYVHNGNATYVSARWGDWYGKLQLQTPRSAHWITEPKGDEIFALINIGGNDEVAFMLSSNRRYVSARFDAKDPRTSNNGYSISVNQGFTLFDSGYGSPVTSIRTWEQFRLLGDIATVKAIIAAVGVQQ